MESGGAPPQEEKLMGGFSVMRMVKFDGEGTVRAYCDLAIGNAFLIKGLRVVKGRNGLFVSMPRQQGKDKAWYDSVSPMTKEAKQEIDRVVLDAYQEDGAAARREG
jgi:stage V sporulation protein G